MNNTENQINELFDFLNDWRKLPAYQLERRADIFFAINMKEIIKDKYQVEIDYLIPEFPIRIGNLNSKGKAKDNQSFKIDYVAINIVMKKAFFIELKTDLGSRNAKQDKYLEKAKELNIRDLVYGIIEIAKNSRSKKYKHLLEKIQEIGWIDADNRIIASEYKIEIVYIQPNNKEEKENVITFQDVVEYLHLKNDILTTRFKKSLETWAIS